ncbi:MAG: family 78 glycoside hydrolase catalytic domain [Bacteroidales bacterium]|nr:family 78 glycoside hydrolase catalytic domain [Bacteroidales bacterium]
MNCSKGKFLTVLTLFLSFYCFSAAGIGVTGLRCDEKTNPTGVSRKDISFSWLWDSGLEKDRQQSYRIVVASDPDKLNSGDYDVWDSGRIKSAVNVHVGYKGKELTGNKKYFWKVMVWNREGKPSVWSKPATFVTALGNEAEWQGAEWIGYEEMPRNERVVPGIHTLENHEGVRIEKDAVVPYLRKSFNAGKAVKEAFLSISGLGHYEAYVNGQKISDFLAPGWTHYDRQVLFNTYEVTDLIGRGENVIAAVVGNGFHYINHKRYLKLGIAFGYPKLICRLKIIYTDGSEDNIVSDTSWKATLSPVVFSSIYGGEDYDANMEKTGWNSVGYDDSGWPDAIKVSAPAGKLEPETTYPLAVTARFLPSKNYTINDSCYTWDFGQNASGIIEVRLKGRKGDKVRIWPGELLSADTIVNQQASGEPYYFEYTLKGDGEEVWRPKFTYYGFRYATVEGHLRPA